MKKQEIFTQVNKLANEFCGCDEIFGVKSWPKERLLALLQRYTVMMEHERIYRSMFQEHFTTYMEFQVLCLNPNPPSWFVTMMKHKVIATHLWRGFELDEALAKAEEAYGVAN